MKEIKLGMSDGFWQEFKEAVEGHELKGTPDEYDYECVAIRVMRHALKRRIDDWRHPETGLSKQEMVHFRRGETEARMWLFSNKDATKEEFELAGKMWIRHAGSAEHVQELILKGWMSVWKD
jgi:hypothetical protein